jgi:DNA cross-link repair 1A protein
MIQDPEMNEVLTEDPDVALVHVVTMGHLNQSHLQRYAAENSHFDQIIAFRPTGWTFHDKLHKKHQPVPRFGMIDLKAQFISTKVVLVPIPYSEHSSYEELELFVKNLDVDHIVPTVNVSKHKEMQKHFELWKKS